LVRRNRHLLDGEHRLQKTASPVGGPAPQFDDQRFKDGGIVPALLKKLPVLPKRRYSIVPSHIRRHPPDDGAA
jgi:hypothetical protein